MQYILIFAGIILIFSFQAIIIIYALPAFALGYFYMMAAIKMFELKPGSAGMIINMIIAIILTIAFLVFIVTNSPALSK